MLNPCTYPWDLNIVRLLTLTHFESYIKPPDNNSILSVQMDQGDFSEYSLKGCIGAIFKGRIHIFIRLVDQLFIFMPDPRDYGLFFRFLQTYSAVGFKGIDPTDPLILEMEEHMAKNDQYFFVGDMICMQILYSSKRSKLKIGVDPSLITPYHFFETTHPDDLNRRSLSRAKIFKTAQDLFIAREGCRIMSSNFRMRNPEGIYENTLYQCQIFYNNSPHNSVYIFQLITNIDGFKMNEGFHYYQGNDLNYFRYPDEELLMTGIPFSQREFEIIQLVGQSLSSEQIAEKLFLSKHTVNTHRRNILKKTGKSNISDLIYTLKEEGLM